MNKKLLMYITLGLVGLIFLFVCISFAPAARLAMQILILICVIGALTCLLLYMFYKPGKKATATPAPTPTAEPTPTPTTPVEA